MCLLESSVCVSKVHTLTQLHQPNCFGPKCLCEYGFECGMHVQIHLNKHRLNWALCIHCACECCCCVEDGGDDDDAAMNECIEI